MQLGYQIIVLVWMFGGFFQIIRSRVKGRAKDVAVWVWIGVLVVAAIVHGVIFDTLAD